MVSYYNTLPYSQKHSAANLAYPGGQPWQWTANYHAPPNHQFLSDMDTSHPHPQMYYNPHPMFHSSAASGEWHSPTSSAAAADSFSQSAPLAHQMLHQHHHIASSSSSILGGGGGNAGILGIGAASTSSASSGSSAATPTHTHAHSGNTPLNDSNISIGENQQQQQQQQQHIAEGLPSPPITVSGSEISSPGVPPSSSSPHHVAHHLNNSNNNNSPTANNNNTSAHNHNHHNNSNNSNRLSPVKAQYFDWMKKPTYPAQPTAGKTRTKDKYRVVYTDYQRLELEKEYCTSRYITIRRKTELAQSLSLSERQVKIWFQNRRAKERKQSKKGSDSLGMGGVSVHQGDYANLMDTKPKLESSLHMQHSLHSMALGMPGMSLHSHLHGHHHPLAVSAAAAHSHQLHQSPHAAQMSAAVAAAAGVGSLTM